MYGWDEADTKLKPKHLIGGEKPSAVFDVGSYEVTVAGENPQVTCRHKYRRESTDPRRTLPNMEIEDGEIRIPVTDLVGEVLTRLEPADLARALWSDQGVRDAFTEAMAHRYMEGGVEEADRRKLLHGIQKEVHSAALDRLSDAMATQEYAARNIAHSQYSRHQFKHWLRAVEDTLTRFPEALEALKQGHGFGKMFLVDPDEKDFSIGGKHWQEARDFWRAEVLRQFPQPIALITEPAEAA